MLDTLMGGVGVMTHCGSNAGDLAGGHGNTDAASANQDTTIDTILPDGDADGLCVIGIVVARLLAVRAQVSDLVAEALDVRPKLVLALEPGMVGGNSDPHRGSNGIAGWEAEQPRRLPAAGRRGPLTENVRHVVRHQG